MHIVLIPRGINIGSRNNRDVIVVRVPLIWVVVRLPLRCTVERIQDTLIEFLFDLRQVILFSEGNVVDGMRQIQRRNLSHVEDLMYDLRISVVGYVEISWHFVHHNVSIQPAPFLLAEGLLDSVVVDIQVILIIVVLAKLLGQLHAIFDALLYKVALDVHYVRAHNILCVQRQDVARHAVKHDVEVDSDSFPTSVDIHKHLAAVIDLNVSLEFSY